MPLTIKELSETDRPRERLQMFGAKSLSDAELLAILLGSGSRDMTAVELAQWILCEHDNKLGQLVRLSNMKSLCSYKGIGSAKAISILAAFELGRRLPILEGEQEEKPVINTSARAYAHLRKYLADMHSHEEIWVLLLDRSKHPISQFCVSKGSLIEAVGDMRLIFSPAIERSADSVILAHNHPSGEVRPSREDYQLTKRAVSAGNILQIPVVDHLIIGSGTNYFSFADNGDMPQPNLF